MSDELDDLIEKDDIATLQKIEERCDELEILLRAIFKKSYRIVEKCLEKNLDLNREKSGWTPLTAAVAMGDAEITKKLIERGANVSYSAEGEPSPIALACMAKVGSPKACVEVLLEHGANPNGMDGLGRSCLCLISNLNHGYEMAKIFLKAGADPNFMNSYGTLPLFSAASLGKESIVRLLMSYGADPLMTLPSGKNLLETAQESLKPFIKGLMNMVDEKKGLELIARPGKELSKRKI